VPAEIIPALLSEKLIRLHFLPIGSRTFWRWVSSGQFPRPDISLGGKIRLWKRESVQAWIAANSIDRIASCATGGGER
jgi:predicted DNA-binding transcriptional regulator AlpA